MDRGRTTARFILAAGSLDLCGQRNGPELDNELVQSWAKNWSRAGQSTGTGPEKEHVTVELAEARIGKALLGWVWVVWRRAVLTALGLRMDSCVRSKELEVFVPGCFDIAMDM